MSKNRKPFFSDIGKIKGISFGLVYIFFNLWIMLNVPNFFPADQQAFWFKVTISYLFLNVVVFANADMRNKLFNVKFVDFVPRFALFLGGFGVFFFFLLQWADPLAESGFGLLANVPIWLAMVQAFTVATTESIVWQGFLDTAIGLPWSSLVAGLFHMFVWSGAPVLVFIMSSLLFLFFSYIHWFFRTSDKDLAPVIGAHSAYNIVKLSFLFAVGGAAV